MSLRYEPASDDGLGPDQGAEAKDDLNRRKKLSHVSHICTRRSIKIDFQGDGRLPFKSQLVTLKSQLVEFADDGPGPDQGTHNRQDPGPGVARPGGLPPSKISLPGVSSPCQCLHKRRCTCPAHFRVCPARASVGKVCFQHVSVCLRMCPGRRHPTRSGTRRRATRGSAPSKILPPGMSSTCQCLHARVQPISAFSRSVPSTCRVSRTPGRLRPVSSLCLYAHGVCPARARVCPGRRRPTRSGTRRRATRGSASPLPGEDGTTKNV